MLIKLTISNYALINELSVEFSKGLNTVTGETGAGKSIILGALGLILGNRADLSVLKEKSKKCIVEGIFEIGNYNTEAYFIENDLDYESMTIFRREITPAGKSRAFINDTPVNLKIMRDLGLKLIDIHSQHQNLELSNQKFQLNLVDTVSGSQRVLNEYQKLYAEYLFLQKSFAELKQKSEKAKADLDYFQFQFNQLEEAKLEGNEQLELESELEKLTHAEEIKSALLEIQQLMENDHFSVIQNLKESQKVINKIENFISDAASIEKRLQSSLFELRDILDETEMLAEKVEYNPERIEQVNNRLNLLYGLEQKHRVSSVKELIDIRNYFDEKINAVVAYDNEIKSVELELQKHYKILESKSGKLSAIRIKSFSKIEKSVVSDLKQLGMPKSKFTVEHQILPDFGANGQDTISFLFNANSDTDPAEISKIASGGEMSRLMLAIKNLLRSSKALPTVIFDEIDSGFSGEIALKMGSIIKSFSSTTQIINITHLPQIAARGDAHFQVYKFEKGGKTFTSIRKLSDNERVEELAKMVGGDNITENTLKTAQELLNG